MKIRNIETDTVYNNRNEAAKELNISRYKLDKLIKKGEKLENVRTEKEQEHSSCKDGQNNPVL